MFARVKWYNSIKGYGFISPVQGKDVFIHASALNKAGIKDLQTDQTIEFDIEKGKRGDQACNIRIIK